MKTVEERKKLRGRQYSSKINRWTGQPHEHKREITRRKRQQEARNGSN